MFHVALVLLSLIALPGLATAACGDGVVTAGEECDDGNLADGDCCSSSCILDYLGFPCADEGNLCSNDVCDGTGTCTHTIAPAPTCLQPFRAGTTTFALKNLPRQKLGWQWKSGPATLTSDFGDPTIDTDYALCVYDYAAGVASLAVHETVPAGVACPNGPCWRVTAHGFTYNDAAASYGFAKLKLVAGSTGKARVQVKGKNAELWPIAMPMAQDPTVVVQLRNAVGKCWGTTHGTAKRNDGLRFIAKSD